MILVQLTKRKETRTGNKHFISRGMINIFSMYIEINRYMYMYM